MTLNSNSGTINTTAAIITFLVGISISLAVALFHHYYFPQKYVSEKTDEIARIFDTNRDFPSTAKRLLSYRTDIAYLKLLDQNGVLEESFGNDSVEGTDRFLLNAPENKTVVLGMYKHNQSEIDSYSLVWSVLIGSVLSVALVLYLFLHTPWQDQALKKLESAMERVAAGDLTARLEVDSPEDDEIGIMSVYQSFNRMVNVLNRKFGNTTETYSLQGGDSSPQDGSDDTGTYEYSPFSSSEQPEEEPSGEDTTGRYGSYGAFSSPEAPGEKSSEEDEAEGSADDKVVDFEGYNDKTTGDEKEKPEAGEKQEFRPRIVLPDTGKQVKKRMVTALVAKISDFDQLTENMNSAELNSFLTSYRKAASTIIGDYGGVIEALLQDEIVALFNAPDEQNKPELRAICASVEVLQILAKMSRDRRSQGKPLITGKIGIGADNVSFTTGSGVPGSVKNIVSSARDICEKSDEWKVQISEQLYDIVREHVEADQRIIDGETVYSVSGVEEGIIEL